MKLLNTRSIQYDRLFRNVDVPEAIRAVEVYCNHTIICKFTFLVLGTFWLYAGFALLGTIFFSAFLPETKGKSLEQVAELFRLPLCL